MSVSPVISEMLASYRCQNEREVVNALREIMQNVALLAFSRTDFFQKAAFYGGTALRILYGLNRGSEDMDFTLLEQDESFDLMDYSGELETEFNAYGLHAVFTRKVKLEGNNIQSGFLKSNTHVQLLSIGIDEELIKRIHPQSEIKIKVEVDVCPPEGGQTEIRYVYQPIPFAIRSCSLPMLLSGKLHAVLFRKWRRRIKGRDWYDLAWYAAKHPEYDLRHLEMRARQSGDYNAPQALTSATVQQLLIQRLEELDIDAMKDDVRPFLRNPKDIDFWDKPFFLDAFNKLKGIAMTPFA